MKTHLTERIVKAAQPVAGPDLLIRDDEVIGFGLCVYASGAKAFFLDFRVAGRKRYITIGSWPDWSVVAAREEAKALKRKIDQGGDPLAQRQDVRGAPTIRDMIDRYIEEHTTKLAPRNAADQKSMLRKFVEPEWGARKVADITHEDVDKLLAEVAKGRPRWMHDKRRKKTDRKIPKRRIQQTRHTPVRANRLGECLRKMFNIAVRWKMRADNPAQGFARNPEPPRERYLSKEEINRLSSALADHPNRRSGDVIRLILLTGARRGEALNARWDQFDLDSAIWTKPAATTKQRRLHRAPLSGAAVALLRTIRARVPEDCPWVFPGDAEGKPLIELKRFWDDVRVKATLADIRIHDLRHTFASLLVSGGMSLPMIGKLLGHTQVQTTQRYAHLFDDPLRAGLDQVGDMLRPKLRLVEALPEGDNAVA